jgi:hypothetical protein
MAKRPRQPPLGDLFALFPDLPWPRLESSPAAQLARVRRSVAETRERALRTIRRQREAIEAIRASVAARLKQSSR